MLDRVLRDHPDSAKAHFVQAEIDAAEGHRDLARSELARAEQLKPGLPDVKPRSVRELKAKLGLPADEYSLFRAVSRAAQNKAPWQTADSNHYVAQ